MSNKIAVSLIVPVYNVLAYIEEFLNSVVAQTFENYEAILVDDGSTDGTGEVLDRYAAMDKRIRVVHKENGGVVSAWKRGVCESCGEYLCFADPDDILDENMIATQYSLANDNAADMAITGYRKLVNGQLIAQKAVKWFMEEGVCEGERLETLKNKQHGDKEYKDVIIRAYRWNKIFKRNLIVDNLQYTDDHVAYGDDICMFMAALYDSKKIVYNSSVLYTYRIRPQSLTNFNFSVKDIANADLLTNAINKVAADKGYQNDFNRYGYHTMIIKHLLKGIAGCGTAKEKKRFLKELAHSQIVKNLDMKKTKRCISRKRYLAIWLLRHRIYTPLLWYCRH